MVQTAELWKCLKGRASSSTASPHFLSQSLEHHEERDGNRGLKCQMQDDYKWADGRRLAAWTACGKHQHSDTETWKFCLWWRSSAWGIPFSNGWSCYTEGAVSERCSPTWAQGKDVWKMQQIQVKLWGSDTKGDAQLLQNLKHMLGF